LDDAPCMCILIITLLFQSIFSASEELSQNIPVNVATDAAPEQNTTGEYISPFLLPFS
jgi:hypothetical protein